MLYVNQDAWQDRIHIHLSQENVTQNIFALTLHDALPICELVALENIDQRLVDKVREAVNQRNEALYGGGRLQEFINGGIDRKSTRLNSSHVAISYAVFCLKKNSRGKTTNWARR